MERVEHPDGVWNTSEHRYKNRRVLIKSQKGKGMKGHVFLTNSDKVGFTLRYSFIAPGKLLQKLKRKIDAEEP